MHVNAHGAYVAEPPCRCEAWCCATSAFGKDYVERTIRRYGPRTSWTSRRFRNFALTMLQQDPPDHTRFARPWS